MMMMRKIGLWALLGCLCFLGAGCAVRHAPPSVSQEGRRYTRGEAAQASQSSVVTQGDVARVKHVSMGEGMPERREVPALVAAYSLPQPVATPAPAPTPPAASPAAREAPAASQDGAADSYDVASAGRVYRLRIHDNIVVSLRGIPREEQIPVTVDEDGHITLPYIERILAVGLTRSELEQTIRQAYLDQRIYRNLSVNVQLPTQSYFVRGEVRSPSRYPLVPGMTVLQALTAAGGYTEFANPKRIRIVRGNEVIAVDAREIEQKPELDQEVEPGDTIIVPRSII